MLSSVPNSESQPPVPRKLRQSPVICCQGMSYLPLRRHSELQPAFSRKFRRRPAMLCQGMSYLPLCWALLSTATFVTTYIIAVYNGDVSPKFPYISEIGTKPPESCIFSQFLNICAALCLCTVYVRYKLVEAISGHEYQYLHRLNQMGLGTGVLTALGLSLVANFQTGLSYKMHPEYSGIYVARVRLALTIASFIVIATTAASAVLARQFHPKNRRHWKPEEPGYVPHIISAVSEWITFIVFLMYFLTFVRDFMKLRIEVKPRLFVRHLDEPALFPDENIRLPA
ncbi:DRAM2-like protein [Mya arenaria]|uniref:DRAM2-like protein n=1 Tax=Mya arenaria TaxID=6604 RepID=A0ABY7DVJ6_MYAAR|nr:DRAM2-like protein [Mya arenaria]